MLVEQQRHERDRFVHQEIESLLAGFDEKTGSNRNPDVLKNIREKPATDRVPEAGKVFRDRLKDGSEGPEMVVIAAGSFRMGEIQNSGYKDEKPVHEVTITKPFAMGRYPVTFAEYDFYCAKKGLKKPDDRGWGRDIRPVINVWWKDAGAETDYWWGNEASQDYANYGGSQTTPVDQYRPNAYGMYDILGNVWEWVEDCYHDSYQDKPKKDGSARTSGSCEFRVFRGGSWHSEPELVRSAYRLRDRPLDRNYGVGFRLAQDQ